VNCETVKDLLVLLNYGELSFEDEEAVEKHLETCPACAAERRRLEQLGTLLDEQAADVSPDLLARCRSDLSGKLIHEEPRRSGFSLAAWWQGLASAPWLKPAAALALLVVGFAGGRLIHPGQPQMAATRPVMAQPASDRAQVLAPVSTETDRKSVV
jgi:anti-sigma factor RsiW